MKASHSAVAKPALAVLILLAGTSLAYAGNGSSVAVAAQTVAHSCSVGVDVWDIDVAVTAGSAAPATFLISTGGFSDTGTFTNWTSHGRTKAAEQTFQLSVPEGGAQVTVCVTQPGANGNDSRSACTVLSLPATCNGNGGDWS